MLVLIEFKVAALFVVVVFFVVVFFICNRWLKKKSLSRDDDLYNLKDAKYEVSILGIYIYIETDPIAVKILTSGLGIEFQIFYELNLVVKSKITIEKYWQT